jgi:hypothetical protein
MKKLVKLPLFTLGFGALGFVASLAPKTSSGAVTTNVEFPQTRVRGHFSEGKGDNA